MKDFTLTLRGWSFSGPAIALGLITLLGFGLRFYGIGTKTVWLDEAFSLWLAHQPLVDMWGWLIKIDQHPPIYYSLLHYWIVFFGDLQGPVRALSALCGGLAIPFFYGASRYLLDQHTALLAALLLAIAPFHVRYGQEVRMYALLTLAVAVALYLFMLVLFDARARQKLWPWVGLGLAQAAVMLIHNTATIFFPLAINGAVGAALLWKQWQGVASTLPILNAVNFERRWLRAQLLALVGWLPWSVPFVIQSVMVDREFWIGPPSVGVIYETLHNFNLAFIPSWWPLAIGGDLVFWLLAGLGVWSLRQTPARAALLLILFLTPIIGELLVSLRRPIFSDRTLIWATLPYYMLVAAGIGEAGRLIAARMTATAAQRVESASDRPNRLRRLLSERSGAATSIMVVIGLLSGVALSNYYFYFEKEDWAEAAAYVAEQTQPGDLIVFNATWVQLPFAYYFRHYANSADLRGLPVDLFDRSVLEPKMTKDDLPYMRNLLADRERVWLIYSHDWYTDPHGIIPREFQQQMVLVEQRPFVGLQVMHFRRKR